jgi:hypothetical protein
MAPTKTTRKNAPSTSKATQGKGEKNTASKSKATQAKGKENAASTAALQAAKKKNQLRKDSDLGMSYHELNSSTTTPIFFLYPGSRTALANTNTPPEVSGDPTTAATSAAEEIEQLKGRFLLLSCSVRGNLYAELAAEVLLLRKERANVVGHAFPQRAEITAIPKPRGEAGSKGFKLIKEMGLDDTAENKQLYRSIMVRGKKQSNTGL